MKRNLAIGDIHGCLLSLKNLLEMVQPTADDRVILLGDYVDRGPASREVIDYLIDWPWKAELICLKGNHELIMEDAKLSTEHLAYWCQVGGLQTMLSYGMNFEKIPKAHWDFIGETRPYFKTKKFIFVHGGLLPKVKMSEQTIDDLCWRRFPAAKPHQSGRMVVCGHTMQRRGKPGDKGHTVCIDTAACRGGWLTCLDPKSLEYWQTNEKGKSRTGRLKRRKQAKTSS